MCYTYEAGGCSSVSMVKHLWQPTQNEKCICSWEAVSILRRGEGIMEL